MGAINKTGKVSKGNLVGYSFQTGNNATITVLRKSEETTPSGNELYEVVCSKCSLDEELNFKPWLKTFAALRDNCVPCICKGYKNLTGEQWTVILNRHLTSKGLNFDILDPIPDYAKSTFKPKMQCLDCNTLITTMNLERIYGKRGDGCKKCKQKKMNYKPESEHIRHFDNFRKHHPDKVLTKLEEKSHDKSGYLWRVDCKLCGDTRKVTAGTLRNPSYACLCDRPNKDTFYILSVEDINTGIPVAIKYGITYKFDLRLRGLNNNNPRRSKFGGVYRWGHFHSRFFRRSSSIPVG